VSVIFGGDHQKTDVVHGACNPEWDSRFFFSGKYLFDAKGIMHANTKSRTRTNHTLCRR
jgi:hypothetical protein